MTDLGQGCEAEIALFDCGAKIGIAVIRDGERRAVKVANPFWPEIDREWKEAHPDE